MTAEPFKRSSAIATGTVGLGLAVLVASWPPAAAQTPAPGGAQEASEFENGRQQYHRTCAQCHGRNLVNSGVTVYDLRKFPEDQPERFFNSVSNGKGNMPSYRESLSAEQIRALWTYISSRGKSAR